MLNLSFPFDLAELELPKARLPMDFPNHREAAVRNMASEVAQAWGEPGVLCFAALWRGDTGPLSRSLLHDLTRNRGD